MEFEKTTGWLEPKSSIAPVLLCYRTLHKLERSSSRPAELPARRCCRSRSPPARG